MVIRGRTRGNGRQLANYLLFMNENEDIQILDVAGRPQAAEGYLHDTLFCMSLTSELTKSDKGLYHAQINPAYGDDAGMTSTSWLQAADMLAKELGLEEQRRVIVLHTKKGRTHAHVVWERYDLEKGRMISDSFSRLAQDRARKEMERVFEHKQTPHRNARRPEMKETLSALWQKAKTGLDFLKDAGKAGYIIAKGVQRRPFMVVDETGRSFDLVRQLQGTKTKEVRDRLKTEKLQPEKEAILTAKAWKSSQEIDAIQERAVDKIEGFIEQNIVNKEAKKASLVQAFADDRKEMIQPGKELTAKERAENTARAFDLSREIITQPAKQAETKEVGQEDKKQDQAGAFAVNRHDTVKPETEKERKRSEMLRQLKEQRERNEKSRDKDYERD